MPSAKPLAGLKVVDFSMAYAGPICGRMMSDCGADVIKIEPTRFSDGVRSNSRIFAHFNAGKLGVQIDLSSPEGQQLAHELIDSADVVIENYRPGIMAKFGLDYASLKPQHPIKAAPLSPQAAPLAPIAHAASGYDVAHMGAQIHASPPVLARPQASGIMIADMLTGAYAFGAIQTALLGRVTSGLGDHIDVTMLESMMTLIPGHQQAAQVVDAPQMGGFLPITASDGYIMACVVSDKNFEGLCTALVRMDLHADARFDRASRIANVRYLVGEIEKWSATRTVVECETHFNRHGIPCSRYNSAADLFDEPQLQHRGAFTRNEDEAGEYFVQNLPFQFASMDNATTRHAPALGEHTDVVFADIGLDKAAIAALRESGVVA